MHYDDVLRPTGSQLAGGKNYGHPVVDTPIIFAHTFKVLHPVYFYDMIINPFISTLFQPNVPRLTILDILLTLFLPLRTYGN